MPALAVSAELKRRGANILVVGARRPQDQALATEAGFAFRGITAGKLRRYAALRTLLDPFKVIVGFVQSLRIIRSFRPAVVFAKGGFVSLPVVWAARLRGVPVVLHESDTVAGLANRRSAKRAARVAVGWPPELVSGLPESKMVHTGNPLRDVVTRGSRETAISQFDLDPALPIVLVLGGSQGSVAINELVVRALPELLAEAQVVHQVGERSSQAAVAWQSELTREQNRRYRPKGYFGSELYDLYDAADIVVARAGAGALAEIAANGKPSILIPLPSAAGNHQRKNAEVFGGAGASIVLEQGSATPEELARQVKLLLHDSQRRTEIGRAAKSLAVPNATQKVADLVWEVGSAREKA